MFIILIIAMIFVYVVCILALSVTAKHLQCKNGVRTILTRTREEPYLFEYKCLCPFNFFGPDCN